jgi:hypothetical protein
MDRLRDQHNDGRAAMIGAFAELTTLALRAGVEGEAVTVIHGRFFDGNVRIKSVWRAAVLLAEISQPGPARFTYWRLPRRNVIGPPGRSS